MKNGVLVFRLAWKARTQNRKMAKNSNPMLETRSIRAVAAVSSR
ncbi:MAG: hypothetical protein R2789_06805 [Microthrixaceae bacterium]